MTRNEPALPADHESAWRSWLRAHALLVRVLDGDLRAEHGMTLLTHDALVQLSEAPGRQLYMKDLAAALVYSASGLTRIVDGLERAGYARRAPDPDNRRATRVVLTPAGLPPSKPPGPPTSGGHSTLRRPHHHQPGAHPRRRIPRHRHRLGILGPIDRDRASP